MFSRRIESSQECPFRDKSGPAVVVTGVVGALAEGDLGIVPSWWGPESSVGSRAWRVCGSEAWHPCPCNEGKLQFERLSQSRKVSTVLRYPLPSPGRRAAGGRGSWLLAPLAAGNTGWGTDAQHACGASQFSCQYVLIAAQTQHIGVSLWPSVSFGN